MKMYHTYIHVRVAGSSRLYMYILYMYVRDWVSEREREREMREQLQNIERNMVTTAYCR